MARITLHILRKGSRYYTPADEIQLESDQFQLNYSQVWYGSQADEDTGDISLMTYNCFTYRDRDVNEFYVTVETAAEIDALIAASSGGTIAFPREATDLLLTDDSNTLFVRKARIDETTGIETVEYVELDGITPYVPITGVRNPDITKFPKELSETVWTDNNGGFFLRKLVYNEADNITTISYTLADGTTYTPIAGLRPAGSRAINGSEYLKSYLATTGGIGYSAGDEIEKRTTIVYTDGVGIETTTWVNVDTGLTIAAPPITNLTAFGGSIIVAASGGTHTPSATVETTSGTVAAGAYSVLFEFSDDFVGTVLGVTRTNNFSSTADTGKTLLAFPYTISAGSITITKLS